MLLQIHPKNPQQRLIKQVSQVLNSGGIISYPTDSGYCLATATNNKKGIERIRKIRNLPKNHNWTLMIDDLKNIAKYAKVDNNAFRLLKKITPGGWTFILQATKLVPAMVLNKRKTIGIRISSNNIVQEIIKDFGVLMSVSLIIEGYDFYDIDDVLNIVENNVDLVIDGGYNPPLPTTVIDLSCGEVEVIRVGSEDISKL